MAVNYLLKNAIYGKNNGYRKFIFTVFLNFQSILLQHGLSVWNKYSYSEFKSGLLLEIELLIQNWPSKRIAASRDTNPHREEK